MRPVSTLQFDYSTDKWRLVVYNENDYAIPKDTLPAESPDILLEMLGQHWRIDNLHEFDLEVAGVSQMKLPL